MRFLGETAALIIFVFFLIDDFLMLLVHALQSLLVLEVAATTQSHFRPHEIAAFHVVINHFRVGVAQLTHGSSAHRILLGVLKHFLFGLVVP